MKLFALMLIAMFGIATSGCGSSSEPISAPSLLDMLKSQGGTYELDFKTGTSIDTAKAAVVSKFPTDARITSFSIHDICALMSVRSESLENGLAAWGDPGRLWVEFDNDSENVAHTVYDPSSIETAILAVQPANVPPEC